MTEYFNQYFNPENESYSIIIEDDGKVAYAYLLREEEIIGDVWLYNNQDSPVTVNWHNEENMPFINPLCYIDRSIEPINIDKDVEIVWEYKSDVIKVLVYIHKELIAILKPESKPGWSLLVKEDGPLAKKMTQS